MTVDSQAWPAVMWHLQNLPESSQPSIVTWKEVRLAEGSHRLQNTQVISWTNSWTAAGHSVSYLNYPTHLPFDGSAKWIKQLLTFILSCCCHFWLVIGLLLLYLQIMRCLIVFKSIPQPSWAHCFFGGHSADSTWQDHWPQQIRSEKTSIEFWTAWVCFLLLKLIRIWDLSSFK